MSAFDATCSSIASAAEPGDEAVSVIQPRKGWQKLDLRTLWQYRDLLRYLTLRDIQVRYKQTVLGAAWAVIQPVAMMLVACVFFGRLLGVAAKVPVPYPIFFFAGMLAWNFFAGAVNASSMSLINSAQMLRKVYFPRLIVPIASIGAPAVDLAISSLVLVALMFWYGVALSWQILLIPFITVSIVAAVLGVGLMLAAPNVAYRDFRHVVPVLPPLWVLVSPVIFPVAIVPESWQWVLHLNPMGGSIEAFRAAVLGSPLDYGAWAISTAASLLLLAGGLAYFTRTERRFADVV